MLLVRENTAERLVVGVSRQTEFAGLLLSGLGLFGLSALVISYVDADFALGIPLEILPHIAYYLVLFGMTGVLIVFSQRRFVFLAEQKVVVFRQGFGKQKIWRYDQLGFVELQKRSNSERAAAFLLLANGHRETLSRGGIHEMRDVAEQVANYAGISVKPLVVEAVGNSRRDIPGSSRTDTSSEGKM